MRLQKNSTSFKHLQFCAVWFTCTFALVEHGSSADKVFVDQLMLTNNFVEINEAEIVDIFQDEVSHRSLSNVSFFTSFPRVIIRLDQIFQFPLFFELSEEIKRYNVEYSNLRNLLTYVASLNKKYCKKSKERKCVEIFVSLGEEYKNHISPILSVISMANAVYSETVSTLVFAKGRQLQGTELHNFVREIGNITSTIRQSSIPSLRFGVFMSPNSVNCSGLATLPLNLVSVIIIPVFNYDNETMKFEHCLQFREQFWNFSMTELGFQFPNSIFFNDSTNAYKSADDNTSALIPALEHINKFSKLKDTITVVSYSYTLYTQRKHEQQIARMLTSAEAWIKSPVPYNKKDLGFSVYYDTKIFNVTKLFHMLVTNSPTVVIENYYGLHNASKQQLNDCLNKLINSIENFYGAVLSANVLSDGFISARVAVKLNLPNDIEPSLFEYWMKVAIDAAKKANERLLGTIENVVAYMPALGDKLWNIDKTYTTNLKKYDQLLKTVQSHRGFDLSSDFKVGLVLPEDRCKDRQFLDVQAAEVIMYHYSQFLNINNDRSDQFFDELRTCLSAINNKVQETVHYVKLSTFIPGSTEFGFKNSNYALKYAQFLRSLNNLVQLQKFKVFLAPAFEVGESSARQFVENGVKCKNASKTMFGATECDEAFGFWSVSLNANNTNEYIYKDRHTAAKEILKQHSPPSQNFSTIVPTESQDSLTTLWWILLPVVVILIILIAVAVFMVWIYRKNSLLRVDEVRIFFEGEQTTEEKSPFTLKYNKEKYELNEDSFQIDESQCLGDGEFGMVFLGTLVHNKEELQVAVKTIKDGSTSVKATGLRSLLSEIKLLSYIGTHDHIICLVGAYTANLRSGNVLVFLELCSLGSLEKYLRTLEIAQATKLAQNVLDNLFRWSQEIADGMEFLASKDLVHADLAMRNILLTSEKTAKISDFGLSRRLYGCQHYVKEGQEPLPWRWMAPEALRLLKFNEKTDIWSYGVTIWEIYSLGNTPYPGVTWSASFLSSLECGERLEKPKYNDKDMYTVMLKCWSYDANQRPCFSQIKAMMEKRTYEIVI